MLRTVVTHHWTIDCQECEHRRYFNNFDKCRDWLFQHRDETGHHVVQGMAAKKTTVDEPSHNEAIANVVNVLGINRIISDDRPAASL
jgi:hypothetical protein